MKTFKVFGTGCTNCKTTVDLVRQVAESKGQEIALEKVEDIQQIVASGVMATPAVMMDDQMVHSGGIPSRDKVESWFA